ncbi:integrase [Paraburkholderia sp. BL8N3]|nr:integrase arm-type DNA-binding domain-containing protein [Paraburkholderia sp. BL8N3]TCK36675.1 integrase [Paraburkholderia sp. BL8N3]
MPKLATRKPDLVFRNAKPRIKPYQISDGGGLSLLIQPNGSKLWLFRYRRPGNGAENFTSLGPYRDISPTQARSLAAAAREQVRAGVDPVQRRRETKAVIERSAKGAFEIVANDWLENKRKGWSRVTASVAGLVIAKYLIPALKFRPIATLSTTDVIPVLMTIATKAPNLAVKARQYLKAIITFAVHNSLREDGRPLALDGVIPSYEKRHIPAITRPEHIGPLVRAIDAYSSPITRAALQVALLTALRPGEIAGARWDEIDLDAGVWRVRASRMKMKDEHVTSLPTQAVTMLRVLQAKTGRGTYVFPSPCMQKTPHIKRDALSAALRTMGFQGRHSTHGFRAMLLTVAAEQMGVDLNHLDAQLAHAKRGDVAKAYNRTTFEVARREVMQRWADYIDERRADPPKVTALPVAA